MIKLETAVDICIDDMIDDEIAGIKKSLNFTFDCCIGWRKLFEQAQDVLRELSTIGVLPDDLRKKATYLVGIESLPKKYIKEHKNG